VGEAYMGTEFILGRNPDTLRGPNVAFVHRARLIGAPSDGWLEGSPDLVIEVISDEDRPGARSASTRKPAAVWSACADRRPAKSECTTNSGTSESCLTFRRTVTCSPVGRG
jgi:hypothetical protein